MRRALYDSKSTNDDRGISQLLDDAYKVATWLEVEQALAACQAAEGVIPREAAEQIGRIRFEDLDLDEMERIKARVGHGFVPFVKVLVAAADEPGCKYVHYGVTTQNIQQTAQMLTCYRVHRVFMGFVADILESLSSLAERHADTVMAGRTHGKHAIPITYGYKVSVWISELIAAQQRLQECEKRVFQVMMGGAVGAFNATGKTGWRVQQRVAQKLEMGCMPVPSRNIFSTKVEYVMNLSLLCNALHKMAEEVYYTGLEEFGEVCEPFEKGTIGSSTMPQKINPKLAKGIIANSSKLYSLVTLGLSSGTRMFEGDSSEYMLFDGVLEEALQLTTEVLIRAEELTRGIQVNKERMYANACINHGLDNSENVMMHLASRLGKDKAHELVYEKAMLVELEGRDFIEVLEGDEVVAGAFSRKELEEMTRPEGYVGISAYLAHSLAEDARECALELRRLYQ